MRRMPDRGARRASTRVRRGRVSVYGLDSEVAGSSMDRLKDYYTKQLGCGNRMIAIDLNPSDVVLA